MRHVADRQTSSSALLAPAVLVGTLVLTVQGNGKFWSGGTTVSSEWTDLAPLLTPRMTSRVSLIPSSNITRKGSIDASSMGVIVTGGNPIELTHHKNRKSIFVKANRAHHGWHHLWKMRTGGRSLKSTEIFLEQQEQRWIPGPDMLYYRSAHAAATLHSNIYIFGGIASNVSSGADGRITETVEQLSGSTWALAPSLPGASTGLAAATLPDENQILIVGGFCSVEEGASACAGARQGALWWYTNRTFLFDGTHYHRTADYPCEGGEAPHCGLSNIALTSCGGSVWAVGGGGGQPSYDGVYVFDPETRTWRTGPSLPTPVSWAAVSCTSKSMLVVSGGMDAQFNPTAAVWVLNTSTAVTQSWRPGPPLPEPRGFTGGEYLSESHTVLVAGGTGTDRVFGLSGQ